jgi:hypothetical protein
MGVEMADKQEETRGRKSLAKDEPTVRIGACIPLSLYDYLIDLGERSGKGYSYHVRDACLRLRRNEQRRKKKGKK